MATVEQPPAPRYEVLPLRGLSVDRAYQRDLDTRRAQRIADRFDPVLLDPLDVNLRPNGVMTIIDGQHRFHALRILGITETWCKIVEVPYQAEARAFAVKQAERRGLRAYPRFRALREAGDPEVVAIDATVREFGWRVEYGANRVKAISAVGALQTIYRSIGRDGLAWTLDVIYRAYGDEAEQIGDERAHLSGAFLRGLARFRAVYGDAIDTEHLVAVLTKKSAHAIVREAAGRATTFGGGNTGVPSLAEVIRELYNSRKRVGRLEPQVISGGPTAGRRSMTPAGERFGDGEVSKA